ncbi:hypothetical protein AADZ91_04845 [Colwelliaceae bacterium 6441]
MERLQKAQYTLTENYKAYNDVATAPLKALDINDEVALKALLDTLMNRESVSHIQHKKPLKESTELRSAIADVLLLLDGCDIKIIKAEMKNSSTAETT